MIYRPCIDCGADTPFHSPRCFRCEDSRSQWTWVHKMVTAICTVLIVVGLYLLAKGY